MQFQPLLRVFIGYDPVETVAWHTFAHSILRQSSIPVALVPVNIRNLGGIFTRPRDSKQSNEFSFTRFLVPHLSGYNGLSVFFDCDMLLRCDIAELLDEVALLEDDDFNELLKDEKPLEEDDIEAVENKGVDIMKVIRYYMGKRKNK